jgi:hypothetical protein
MIGTNIALSSLGRPGIALKFDTAQGLAVVDVFLIAVALKN